jgi:hypothetical protein
VVTLSESTADFYVETHVPCLTPGNLCSVTVNLPEGNMTFFRKCNTCDRWITLEITYEKIIHDSGELHINYTVHNEGEDIDRGNYG